MYCIIIIISFTADKHYKKRLKPTLLLFTTNVSESFKAVHETTCTIREGESDLSLPINSLVNLTPFPFLEVSGQHIQKKLMIKLNKNSLASIDVKHLKHFPELLFRKRLKNRSPNSCYYLTLLIIEGIISP